MSEGLWKTPARKPDLPGGEVHVWRIPLTPPPGPERAAWLSADERARAARFLFPRLRERFVAGRAALRSVLAGYTGAAPDQLRFSYGARGKPALVREPPRYAPHFNLSHSGDLALIAVAHDRELGVDLERVRPLSDGDGIVRLFFSARERADHRSLPAGLQERAFFACWTRKEAYIKARGDGLALALDRFAVSIDPEEPAALLHVAGEPREPARWSLRDLRPGPGYVAALAVEGRGWQLRCWQWGG